jgi:hypothetical protein
MGSINAYDTHSYMCVSGPGTIGPYPPDPLSPTTPVIPPNTPQYPPISPNYPFIPLNPPLPPCVASRWEGPSVGGSAATWRSRETMKGELRELREVREVREVREIEGQVR